MGQSVKELERGINPYEVEELKLMATGGWSDKNPQTDRI